MLEGGGPRKEVYIISLKGCLVLRSILFGIAEGAPAFPSSDPLARSLTHPTEMFSLNQDYSFFKLLDAFGLQPGQDQRHFQLLAESMH